MSTDKKKGFDYVAARAAIDARRVLRTYERKKLRCRDFFRRDLPYPKHLLRIQRRQYRELLVVASLEATLAARSSKSDFAWLKLYRQREAYARRAAVVQSVIGTSLRQNAKLFDIKLHLTSMDDADFDDVVPTLPLRDAPEHYYWQPRRLAPYVQPFVTDGTLPVGGLKVEFACERFMPVSIHDYRYGWDDRFLFGPIDAFVFMRCTSGEDAADGVDQAVDNKDRAGKKHPRTTKAQLRENARQQSRRQEKEKELADKRNGKRKVAAARRLLDEDDDVSDTASQISDFDIRADAQSVAVSPYFDESNIASSSAPSTQTKLVTPYDYAHEPSTQSITSATSSPKKKEGKAQNKKASYTGYVEYDDPTLPDPVEIQKEEWSQRYIRGETLYWMDGSLTQNLSDNLYFDSSSIDLRSASELSVSSFNQPGTSSSVYFEELPFDERRISLDDFQPSSPHSSITHSLYFSADDLPVRSNVTSGETWPAADIFFSEADMPSVESYSVPATITSSDSSIYFDCNSFTTDASHMSSSQTLYEQTSQSPRDYFPEPSSAYTVADTQGYSSYNYFIPYETEEKELTSAMFDARCASPTPTYDQNDISIYGNPSLGIAFIQ